MPYTQSWSIQYPGCLIILLDQSGAMGGGIRISNQRINHSKAEIVATVLNRWLRDLIQANTVGAEVRARADVVVLGYGGESVRSALRGLLAAHYFVSLPELYANPLHIEIRETAEMDLDTGTIIRIPIHFPVWIEPRAEGGTPMCAALERAGELATQWAASHPDNFPPVVINITDGEATDGDPTGPAQKLRTVTTSDGEALLFNCHITELPGPTVEFPANSTQVPNDPFAQRLFCMSSVLPDSCRAGVDRREQPLDPGARGLIFNGDAGSVVKIFTGGLIRLGKTPQVETRRSGE